MHNTEATTPTQYTAWIWQTILLTVLASAAFAFFNYRQDVFGLHGRKPVTIYALERYSKYLLSYRYIPTLYDGILVSNSIAANWDTGQFRKYRVFNVSLRGASIAEEQKIVNNILARGQLKMAVIVLMPSLIAQRESPTEYMTSRDYTASFGSLQTLIVNAQAALERYGPSVHLPASLDQHKFAKDGAMNFPIRFSNFPSAPPMGRNELAGDVIALEELKEVIDNFHAHRVKLYGVYAPLYTPRRILQAQDFRAWQQRIAALFSPQDTLIDLNDDQLASLEGNRQTFPDYFHLTPQAATQVMANLVSRIEGK